MGIVSPGFRGRPRAEGMQLPPGQYLTEDVPVLSTGPTPRFPLDRWEFVIPSEAGQAHRCLMGSYEPLFRSEASNLRLWLGGGLDTPPHAAEIHDHWLPDAQPCYVLTADGWVVDHGATALLVLSLMARGA
jgi:hypothetical protein